MLEDEQGNCRNYHLVIQCGYLIEKYLIDLLSKQLNVHM